jgi:hypothetical protein
LVPKNSISESRIAIHTNFIKLWFHTKASALAIRHNPINLCANLVMDQESSSSGQESLLNTCSNEISPDHLFLATKYFRKMQLEWMQSAPHYQIQTRK